MNVLKGKRKDIYDFVVKETERYGYPPSIREICVAVGLKSPASVHSYLKSLEDMGLISKIDNKKRTLKVNDRNTAPTVQVPILGSVTAGLPIYAHEEILGFIPFEASFGDRENLFALKITGDSMIGAGIFDNDVVIVKKAQSAVNNEIVVAMIDGEATVKRFYRDQKEKTIKLLPENPAYVPIISDQVEILGKVIASVHYFY